MSDTTKTAMSPVCVEHTDELIGVLTAISIVAKRMAANLALLEHRTARNGGDAEDG